MSRIRNSRILNGANNGAAIALNDQNADDRICAIRFPANFAGTQLRVQVSWDNGVTFEELCDDTGSPNNYTITAAAGKTVKIPLDLFVGIRCWRAVSVSPQTADVDIGFITRAFA